MKRIIVAIDGYSGCGKSTTAKALSKALNYKYLDSGAMYRAVTLYFLRNHVSISDHGEIEKALSSIAISFQIDAQTNRCETYLNGLNVEDDIRSMEISKYVSEVSAIAAVRRAMVAQQRKLGEEKGVVMDGRDIGTVVFPKADLKIFMSADLKVRAARRQQELLDQGQIIDLAEIQKNLQTRDKKDTNRKESPLRKAEDAIELDTSELTFEEQLDKVLTLANDKIMEQNQEAN